MLIGFSGPSGSGKTTIVNELAEYLRKKGHDVGVVEEVARQVFKRYSSAYGFESLSELRKSDMLLIFQYDILREQIRQEDKALEKHDIVLTDRTIYDNLFFTIPVVYDCDYDLLEEYLEIFFDRDIKSRYDLIFFCEPINEDVDDGFRTPDIKYRNFQGFIIWRLIPHDLKMEKRVHVLLPESLEWRIEKCLEVLKELI